MSPSPRPLVLVDALNVMRSRWPNIPGERLVERTRAWAASEGADVVIVFDHELPHGCSGADLVATGSGSADDWIVERVATAGRRIWLVTSDRELRRRVAPHVEHVIGGGSLAGHLEALAP